MKQSIINFSHLLDKISYGMKLIANLISCTYTHASTSQIADLYHSSVHFFQQITCCMLRPQLLIKKQNGLTGYCFCIQVDHFSPCDRSE